MNKVQEAKQIPIEEYLRSVGYNPVSGKSSGKYLAYQSMLHNETNPSFYVDKARNKWKDFGIGGRWEDVIKLVEIIENLSFPKALEYLLKGEIKTTRRVYDKESKPGIKIIDVFPLRNPKLFEYLKGRKVNIDLAQMYCQEALVTFPLGKEPDKKHSYIAFKNNKGGYELRNHYRTKIAKVSSSPKYHTEISGEKQKYNLFEGFIDYLSLLSFYKKESFKNTTYVLNSLVNLVFLHQILLESLENNIFLNNDEAADKYLFKGDKKLRIKSLKELGVEYIDRRGIFKESNDINDYVNGKLII